MEDAVEILLVEDDPKDLRLTMRELERADVKNKVVVARDGEEALDFMFCRGAYQNRSMERPPKLILLDLKLPKVDGLQVLRELKTHPQTKAVPIVVLTSSGEERDIVDSYHLGVNSYVQKPIDFDEFRSAIRALGLYWLIVSRLPPDKVFES